MRDHGTVKLSAHRIRLADQATYDYRGTFIVESMQTMVVPVWRVKREQIAARMQWSDNVRGIKDAGRGRVGMK